MALDVDPVRGRLLFGDLVGDLAGKRMSDYHTQECVSSVVFTYLATREGRMSVLLVKAPRECPITEGVEVR